MGLSYFPLYADDFEADTAHLTLAEDGAYNRLLRLCWRTPGCSLPADRDWIYRRMRAHSEEDRRVVDTVLDEFFTIREGRTSNARLTKEWLAANEAHERRKRAGAKGGAAKSAKINDNSSSNAKAMPKQPEPEPEPYKKGEPKGSQKKRGTRLSDDWFLPRDWGEWAMSEGHDVETIRHQAACFKDYWIGVPGQKGVKLDWEATWRNWMRRSAKSSPKRSKGDERLEAAMRAAERFDREKELRLAGGTDYDASEPLLHAGHSRYAIGGGDG